MYRDERKYEFNAKVCVQVRGHEKVPGQVLEYLGDGKYRVAIVGRGPRVVEERHLTPRLEGGGC